MSICWYDIKEALLSFLGFPPGLKRLDWTLLISFHFKPLFIQVGPIEIIDLFFKGDLQQVGYTWNIKQQKTIKDIIHHIYRATFTYLSTFTSTNSIKEHFTYPSFKNMQWNQIAQFQLFLQTVPSKRSCARKSFRPWDCGCFSMSSTLAW